MYTCSLCSSAYVALQICSWLHGCCTSTETNCWVSFCNHSKVYYHYACRLTLIEQCQMERNRSKVHYCYTCRPASIQHNVKCNSQLIMSAARKQLASNLYKTYDLELTEKTTYKEHSISNNAKTTSVMYHRPRHRHSWQHIYNITDLLYKRN